jgi:phage-related protein (TIGR01555 family)
VPKLARMTLHDIRDKILAMFRRKSAAAEPVKVEAKRSASWRAILAATRAQAERSMSVAWRDQYPPANGADGKPWLAMDDAGYSGMAGYAAGMFAEAGLGFLGFPKLAELTQRAEYRLICEVRAEEMTRKWLKLTYAGDEKADDKLEALNQAMVEFKLKEIAAEALLKESFFGRSHIYIDTGATDDPKELRTPLVLDAKKVNEGKLKGFRVVEPLWCYPLQYEASDPLKDNFYRPETWTVQGKEVHRTRLLTVVSMPLPDMLKPAYAFAGLSMIQMAKPYVDNWIRTRQSISDLLHAFSVMVLATDLSQLMPDPDDASGLLQRIQGFTELRDNKGTFVLNKETEELTNVSAQLSGLHELQAQSQEQMAAVSKTPLVKLLGITPSGLNASSDGEIRVFYDNIAAAQEKFLRPFLDIMIKLIQLNLWGKIDPNIGFDFLPLYELSEKEAAEIRKSDADANCAYVDRGVLDPVEVRRNLAAAEDSPYAGLDVEDVPEQPEDDTDGFEDAA